MAINHVAYLVAVVCQAREGCVLVVEGVSEVAGVLANAACDEQSGLDDTKKRTRRIEQG